MGVAKKSKHSSQQNAAKPKKEAVGKAKTSKQTKPPQAEGKRSARLQNQIKIGPKGDVKSKKKSSTQPSSPGKVQKSTLPPQKEKSTLSKRSQTKKKRSAQNDVPSEQSVSQKKRKSSDKPSVSKQPSKQETLPSRQPARNVKNKKAKKIVPKQNEAQAVKQQNNKTLSKPTKKRTTQIEADQTENPKKPSVASKLQKSKRKSAKSPLKKKLGGKIGKSRSPLSSNAAGVGGKAKKKPARSQLKLAVEQNRGVVYFSHLPHGFYENELKQYCGQFGVVTGVHVPRSVNGNSKGFAFVEFKHPEVAEVVAETMNNYLMHTRLVKAELVPLERQKPWIFRNGVNGVKRAQMKKAAALAARTRKLTPGEEEAHKKKALARVSRLRKKLSEKGINLDFTVAS